MTDWFTLLDSTLFTKIKKAFPEKTKTKYSMTDANFASKQVTFSSNLKFPIVQFSIVTMPEIAGDMEGTEINAVQMTVQVDVYSNKLQSDATKVCEKVLEILKEMSFNISTMPTPSSSTVGGSIIYRSMMRGTRKIGNGDAI